LVNDILLAAWNRRVAFVCSKKQRALPDAFTIGNLAARDQRFQHLLNVERVSISKSIHALEQTGMHCLVHGKNSLEHNIDVGTVKPFQEKFLGKMLSVKFRQKVPQLW